MHRRGGTATACVTRVLELPHAGRASAACCHEWQIAAPHPTPPCFFTPAPLHTGRSRRLALLHTVPHHLVFLLLNLFLVAVIRNYDTHMRSAERNARHNRDCAIECAFTLLDLNSNGFVEISELSALLQRVDQPVHAQAPGRIRRTRTPNGL